MVKCGGSHPNSHFRFLFITLLPCFSLIAGMTDSAETRQARDRMVREQIKARGISQPQVLEAMQSVPRHPFVPQDLIDSAYKDHPLPIGEARRFRNLILWPS